LKPALILTLALMIGLGVTSFTYADPDARPTATQSCCPMGSGRAGMMGGGQMGHMMPMMQMMQACTQMMNQMSAMMGQHGPPQQQPPQPEKK
jgi:hypothetical protein